MARRNMENVMSKKIVLWLRKMVKEAGAKGLVFGLSGGIDSAFFRQSSLYSKYKAEAQNAYTVLLCRQL